MTQAGLLEHLKLENVSLSHQLTETQHRSIKEKERIAVQLQGIEVGARLPWLWSVGFFWGVGWGASFFLNRLKKYASVYVHLQKQCCIYTYICLKNTLLRDCRNLSPREPIAPTHQSSSRSPLSCLWQRGCLQAAWA